MEGKGTKEMLYPVIIHSSPHLINVKFHIYKTYIRPILTYVAATWTANLSNNSWKSLERTQYIKLRQQTESQIFVNNHAIRNLMKIPTLRKYTYNLSKTVAEKLKFAPYQQLTENITRPAPIE